jgi:8-oxo-dGTP pyrophosphatase MutT (NUDIX family)
MRSFADDHPDALQRSCAEGHFTGSALVVDPSRRAILLMFHRKVRRWLQPGGHADGEGDLAAVALREATEETGIAGLEVLRPAVDLDIHQFRAAGEPPHLHLDVRFVVLAPAGAEPSGNDESEALRWVGVDELDGLGADPGLQRLAEAGLTALAGRRAAVSPDPEAWRTPPCGSPERSGRSAP